MLELPYFRCKDFNQKLGYCSNNSCIKVFYSTLIKSGPASLVCQLVHFLLSYLFLCFLSFPPVTNLTRLASFALPLLYLFTVYQNLVHIICLSTHDFLQIYIRQAVIYLKRNTFFYLFNIIVPCCMLSILTLMTFWLPPTSCEKVTLGLNVFLAFSMFMLLIAEEVPASSDAVPLIGEE